MSRVRESPGSSYKLFLSPREPRAPRVLPYFGGTRVDTADRRLRVAAGTSGAASASASASAASSVSAAAAASAASSASALASASASASPTTALEPGWWRFEIDGRRAIPLDRAPPADLEALPAVRGHWTDGWIVVSGRELGRIALPPEDEPPPLARVTARRWYSGELLLGSIDFEDDAEVLARAALEEGRPIAELRAVVPSLRVAFALALAMAVARQAGVPVSLREIAPHAVAIGDGGRDVVRALLDRLVAGRQAAEAAARARVEQARAAERGSRLRTAAATAVARRRMGDPAERADAALEAAGARMLAARRLSGERLEVRLIVDDVRLIAVVAADSLQVLDAGLCLAGADRTVTLDSLPSVVREAVRTSSLNLTRHDEEHVRRR